MTPFDVPYRFGLSRHAIHLQELLPGMATRLPCTDVRLRPDMRLFEDGYPDKVDLVVKLAKPHSVTA